MPLCPPFGSVVRHPIFRFNATDHETGAFPPTRTRHVPSGPAACGHSAHKSEGERSKIPIKYIQSGYYFSSRWRVRQSGYDNNSVDGAITCCEMCLIATVPGYGSRPPFKPIGSRINMHNRQPRLAPVQQQRENAPLPALPEVSYDLDSEGSKLILKRLPVAFAYFSSVLVEGLLPPPSSRATTA